MAKGECVSKSRRSKSTPLPKPEIHGRRARKRRHPVLVLTVCGYLAMLLLLWAIIHFVGERWWLAALILFGPRWVLAIPLALLAPLALWRSPKLLWVLAICVIVLAGPLMDLCIPWGRVFHSRGSGFQVRVLTCNTHANAIRKAELAQLIDSTQPQVVALQEWSGGYDGPTLGEGKWYVLTDHELRVQSRWPIRKVGHIVSEGWAYGSAIHYEIQSPSGTIPFFALHLASPHNALESAVNLEDTAARQIEGNQAQRRQQSEDLSRAAQAAGERVILAGDFNLPRDSEIYRDSFSTFEDAFSAGGFGFGWTYTHHGTSTRIDHVLSGIGWKCRRCWAAASVGSPHRPLIAELELIQRN